MGAAGPSNQFGTEPPTDTLSPKCLELTCLSFTQSSHNLLPKDLQFDIDFHLGFCLDSSAHCWF